MKADREVVKTVRAPFAYLEGDPDRSELDPEAYLSVVDSAVRTLTEGTLPGEIRAIAASSASGNLILLDGNDRPLTNIIGWQDRRVTTEGREVLPDLDTEAFYRQIGWPFGFKGMPLAQLCYLKQHEPELLARSKTVAMSTEYLYYHWTGKWGISPSAGVTYYLIDQQKRAYIRPILERLGLTEEQLPPIMPCGAVVGTVTKEASALTGLPEGTPVALGSFDHPSAARGVDVLREGEMLLSCGTSWVAFFPVKDFEKAISLKGLVDPFLSPEGCYGVMTSIASLSVKLAAYAERFIEAGDGKFSTMSSLALLSVPGAHGLTIDFGKAPEETDLSAWPKEDVARAIMESAARLLKKRLELFAEKGVSAERAVMVGGPSEDPVWRQIIEEVCGIRVSVVHGSYAGAVGAAVIAAGKTP